MRVHVPVYSNVNQNSLKWLKMTNVITKTVVHFVGLRWKMYKILLHLDDHNEKAEMTAKGIYTVDH